MTDTMTPKSLLIQLLSLALVLIVSGTSAADSETPDREISTVSNTSNYFTYVSTSTDFNQNDRYSVEFDHGHLYMSYQADLAAATNSDWSYELSFESLVTFVDNGNGYLDQADTILSTADLGDYSYTIITSQNDTTAGFQERQITALSEDGLISFVFLMTSRQTDIGTVQLLPTEVKLTISIHGMSFENGADHVALIMSFSAETGLAVHYAQLGDLGELNLSTSGSGGYLSWSNSVSVDGTTMPVNATWNGSELVFSYPAGQNIVHDPVLGVNSLAMRSGLVSVRGDTPLFAVGLVIASAIVGGAIVLTGRRRKDV